MSNLLTKHKNGNVEVELYDDGTRICEFTSFDEMNLEYPLNMDIKITNYCDNPICKSYCHEQSDENGKHGDLDFIFEVIKNMKGSELAIGGGNPLSHPDLIEFLQKCKTAGIYSNLTINQYHINSHFDMIETIIKNDLAKGIGISLTSRKVDDIKKINELTSNMVLHVIAGVHSIEETEEVLEKLGDNSKVLILGYKDDWGNGIPFKLARGENIDKKIYGFYTKLPRLFEKNNLTVSFDNIALRQLNVKRFFNDEQWNKFYQGKDGVGSMYIDCIKQEYALCSTAKERFNINESDKVKDIFKHIKSLSKLESNKI